MINSSDILNASILIVDDQAANVSLLEQMLRGAGYIAIESTSNPREVCERHRKNRYALILLDLQMPGLDGFQVMEELKVIEKEGYLPVLVITAQPDHKLRALKAGAEDFISKPFDITEVLLRVHNLLEVRLLHVQSEMRARELETSNRELGKANREIEGFYQTLSHELKTPLTSAREFISIVRDGLAGPVTETQAEYLGYARESCDQLTVCVNDLMDAARLESGKMTVHMRKASFGEFAHRVVTGLRSVAIARKIDLRLEVQPGLPEVTFDDTRITQVISNLLFNAAKFTPEGGSIRVAVTEAPGRPEYLQIAVTDTGTGIPPEQLTQIFDRLYQIKAGDASTEKGMGMGLYICRELVRLHHGEIWVESEPGQGSTFKFTLPFEPVTAPATILVVDDDPGVRGLTRKILEECGFQVQTAQDGSEALELMAQQLPSLVILDLVMPVMDGAATLKKIRENWGGVPVIVYTGNATGPLMDQALESSPFTILAKPCSAGQLVETVRQLRRQAETTFWKRGQVRPGVDHESHKGIPKGLKLVPGVQEIRNFEHICP